MVPVRPPASHRRPRARRPKAGRDGLVRFGERRRGRWVGSLGVLALLVAALAALALSDAGAQGKKKPTGPEIAARTDQEREAMALLEKDRMVTARRKAEELLARNPRSMVGHYVLGTVLHRAEGSLAQAMFHLGRSRELYEKQHRHPGAPGAPWQFHRELLFAIQSLAGQMEEYDYQLQILDYYDALYQPDLVAEHAWPLMQLGRFDEARKAAKKAVQKGDDQQKSLGLNTLCAIEGEARKRDEYFKACLGALEHARKENAKLKDIDERHRSQLAVHAYNAALAARTAFEPEQAEKMAIEGTKRLTFTPANPWRFLVRLYADQGRVKEAVDALREMQRWRTRQPAHVRDQVRAETDVAFATVLLLAARTDTALLLTDLALDRPDRRGLVSSTPEQALGAHALLRRALRHTHAELQAEQASWTGMTEQLSEWLRGAGDRLQNQIDDERIIQVLSDEDRLVSTFRVFSRGGIEPVPVWLLGDLVEVLGPGVVSVALKRVRKNDKHAGLAPYLGAVQAEVELARGDEEKAIRLGQAAIKSLPKSESLLRARAAATAAEAARRAGKSSLWLSLLEQAVQLDPSVIRRLGLWLPARVEVSSSSKGARLARELLARSPRLKIRKGGFKIALSGAAPAVQVCLYGPHGGRLQCATAAVEVDPKDKKKPLKAAEYAQKIAETFHREVLAVQLGLSGTDLSSLDGSVNVADQAAREQLEDVLDDLTGE